MIRAYLIIILYILMPILIIEGFKHWTWMQKIGTVVMAYAVGILFALTGFVNFEPEILVNGVLTANPAAKTFNSLQSTIMSLAVPIAIPLMLFNCDFKLWTKALPKTIWSLVGGLASVIVAVVSGYFIFRGHNIPEFEKVASMMTGIYTGGTMNFNALGASLHVQPSTMAIVLAFEMVLTMPYIFFIIGGGYKLIRKILPYQDVTKRGRHDENVNTKDVENYHGMFHRDNLGGMLIGLGLSILFLAIGAGLALLLTGKLNELVIILTITTLSIIASFSQRVRELPKTFELGMFFILIFSIVVASLFDIHSINGGALAIGGFVLWVMLSAAVLHLIFCRIAKVSGDLFCVSQVALLCSPPFVPPVVGAMRNKKVLISGIVIGLVGYAVGTYLGIALYAIIN